MYGFQPGFAKRVREASALHSAAPQEQRSRITALDPAEGMANLPPRSPRIGRVAVDFLLSAFSRLPSPHYIPAAHGVCPEA